MRKRVKITKRCVASRYAAAGETIIEFSGTKLGGLISFCESDDDDCHITIEVYRADPGVIVRAGGMDIPAHTTAQVAPAQDYALTEQHHDG